MFGTYNNTTIELNIHLNERTELRSEQLKFVSTDKQQNHHHVSF